MKKSLKNIFIFCLLISPFIAAAQAGSGSVAPSAGSGSIAPIPININIPNPTTAGDDLMELIVTLVNNVVMPIAAVAVVIYIIWAGFSFVTAQGKPAEIEIAKKRLLWALIGSGILLGAAGISSVVENTIKEVIR